MPHPRPPRPPARCTAALQLTLGWLARAPGARLGWADARLRVLGPASAGPDPAPLSRSSRPTPAPRSLPHSSAAAPSPLCPSPLCSPPGSSYEVESRLSSLPAMSWLKLRGAFHELSTIPRARLLSLQRTAAPKGPRLVRGPPLFLATRRPRCAAAGRRQHQRRKQGRSRTGAFRITAHDGRGRSCTQFASFRRLPRRSHAEYSIWSALAFRRRRRGAGNRSPRVHSMATAASFYHHVLPRFRVRLSILGNCFY